MAQALAGHGHMSVDSRTGHGLIREAWRESLNNSNNMKLKSLLTALAAAAACSLGTLRAEVPQAVTFMMTTYTQRTNADNGTVTSTGNAWVKSYNTQALLNLLAQDKQAQGQWGATVFPAGSKLMASEGWLVVDRANNVLADVSDILSVSEGSNEIVSGKQNNATQLASPSLKSMRVVTLTFDDTGIVGGNGLSFYLHGLATKTVADTTPTSAGVYTESQGIKITGAAGEGSWSDGTPFVCSGNVSTSGKQTFGQTNVQSGFAPASLAGYAATVRISGGPTLALNWAESTWGQMGTGTDTNADNYCAGSYNYVKTGPNSARVTSSDIGMLSWLGTSNYVDMTITMTSSTAATFVVTNGNGAATATVTLSHVSNLVPASLGGKTLQFVKSGGGSGVTMAYANDGTFTEYKASTVSGSGTYTVTQYSPTVAIIKHDYTDASAGALLYVEVSFSTTSGGRAFYSHYETPTYESNPEESGLGTFSVN